MDTEIRLIRYKTCKEHREELPCEKCDEEEEQDDGIPRSYGSQKEQRR